MEQYNRDAEFSYTLGMSITIELLANHPERVIKVYYSSKIYHNEFFQKLEKLCLINDIQMIMDDRVIENLSVKENCYVVAYFKKTAEDLSEKSDHLVLCGLSDEGNLGTIMRTAVSFDIRDIVLIGTDIDYYDPKIVRASMGSIFFSRVRSFDNLDEYLSRYKDHIPYAYADSGEDIHDLRLEKPYALIINSPKDFARKIAIKKAGDVSLDLPLACGIILAALYARD